MTTTKTSPNQQKADPNRQHVQEAAGFLRQWQRLEGVQADCNRQFDVLTKRINVAKEASLEALTLAKQYTEAEYRAAVTLTGIDPEAS